MNGGDVLVATLISRGVDAVFFVPGGTYVTVLKALSQVRNKVRAVPTRIEQAAAFAADAYAALARKPACVFVSRAPGATNAAIGIHTAKQGSHPVVLFVANIPKALKGREAFQEIDYQAMYGPIAKAVFDVHSFREIAPVAARALDLSVSGRPGPVVVVASKDLLDGETGEPPIPGPAARAASGPEAGAVARAARLIDAARRPLIVAGEMVAFERASDELKAFAEATGAGVFAAYRQQDVLANDHPAYFGHLSLNRLPYQEDAIAEADLIVAVGSRLDSVTTADYAMIKDGQKLIMVYPDAAVFSPWQAHAALASDVAPAMAALARAVRRPPPERLAWRDAVHAKEAEFAQPGEVEVKGRVDMAKVIQAFNRMAPKDAIMVSDAGTFARWISRYYRYNRPDTSLGPVSGAMGYGIPGAVGAQLAAPGRTVFAWVGDGGFLMTGHEAATAVQERLPIKIIVCDNGAWGSILVHQQKRFGDWDFGVRLKSPDFAALGRGYGMPSFTVKETGDFEGALDGALAASGPALVHLCLDVRDVSPFGGVAR
jgi:acetolactate synthase-1/2/3 large subunit